MGAGTRDRCNAALARTVDAEDAMQARRQAVVLHAAVLGQIMMITLAEAVGDPLKKHAEQIGIALTRSDGGEGPT